jgi:hypothetical protein
MDSTNFKFLRIVRASNLKNEKTPPPLFGIVIFSRVINK